MGLTPLVAERGTPVLKGYLVYCASVLAVLGTALVLTACSQETVRAAVDLVPLQRKLEAEFDATNLEFGLHDGDTLSVTLLDSRASGFSWCQKAERARDIAESVCESYGSMGRYDRVRVTSESRHEGTMGDVSGSVGFSFEKGELQCGDH